MENKEQQRNTEIDRLAESFSSDVINEAISEIIAEEDIKDYNGDKWYRQEQSITPPRSSMQNDDIESQCAQSALKFTQVASISGVSSSKSISQTIGDSQDQLEKVSPIISAADRINDSTTIREKTKKNLNTSTEELPKTSDFLKVRFGDSVDKLEDIPGYVSPASRNRLLGIPSANPYNDMMMTTVLNEENTIVDEDGSAPEELASVSRKHSVDSNGSNRDDISISSKSHSSKCTSSIGSSTVYVSVAGDAFKHIPHLSPLLDASSRSENISPVAAAERPKSAVSATLHGNSTDHSPREGTSRVSSCVTEYDALPANISQSNISTSLQLSPDLAKRVSAILNSPKYSISKDYGNVSIPKLSFDEESKSKLNDSSEARQQPKAQKENREHSRQSYTQLPREQTLQSPQKLQEEPDLSYLDKYMTSPYSRIVGLKNRSSSNCSEESDNGLSMKYLDKSSKAVLEQAAKEYYASLENDGVNYQKDSDRDESRSISQASRLSSSDSEIKDELSRLVDKSLEKDSLPYKSPDNPNRSERNHSRRHKLDEDGLEHSYGKDQSNSKHDRSSRNSRRLEVSCTEEKLCKEKTWAKTHPLQVSQGSRSYNSSLERSRGSSLEKPVSELRKSSPGQHISDAPRPVTLPASQEETQSLVTKRLDRIEFMVLSALNEIPPQTYQSVKLTPEPPTTSHGEKYPYQQNSARLSVVDEVTTPESSRYEVEDLRGAIKTSEARSPIERLPDYNQDEYRQPPVYSAREDESFNISISPVKRDPFAAFNKAQELLADRLAQRASERTPLRSNAKESLRPTDNTPASYVQNSSNRQPGTTASRSSYANTRQRDKRREITLSRLENIPDSKPLEISEAGRSPSDDLIRRLKHRTHSTSSVDSVTTVESTHTESDDAEPPTLPEDAYGSRKDPPTPSPGIYGTRTPKSNGSRTPRSGKTTPAPKLDDREEDKADGSREDPSFIIRAEEALAKANQLREKLHAPQKRKHDVTEEDNSESVVELLNSTYKTPLKDHYRSVRKPERDAERLNRSNNNGDARFSSPRSDMDATDPHGGVDALHGKSVVLDFYTPPRVSRRDTAHGSRGGRYTKLERTPVITIAAYENGQLEEVTSPSPREIRDRDRVESGLRRLDELEHLRQRSKERQRALEKAITEQSHKLREERRQASLDRYHSGKDESFSSPEARYNPRDREMERSLEEYRSRSRERSEEIRRSLEAYKKDRAVSELERSQERQRSLELSKRQAREALELERSLERQRSLERLKRERVAREHSVERQGLRQQSQERQRSLQNSRSEKVASRLESSLDRSTERTSRSRGNSDGRRMHELKRSLERSREERSPSRTRSPVARPLERADSDLDGQDNTLRSKLARAVTDRMKTYHILREELMKTEDEAKGRELQHAWQCLNKRRPKSRHDDSTATETSTVISEMFSDERMNKLKNLLNNPLSHLITKKKSKEIANKENKAPLSKSESQEAKYEKLKEIIKKQKDEASNVSAVDTQLSTDDTICSRCEEKRKTRKSSKNAQRKQTAKQTQNESAKGEDDDEQSEAETECNSDTRPVTPTNGITTPHINSSNNNQHAAPSSKAKSTSTVDSSSLSSVEVKSRQSERPPSSSKYKSKTLRDVGVMCPTPLTSKGRATPNTQSAVSSQNSGKAYSEEEEKTTTESKDKEAVAWYVDAAGPASDRNKKQTAFDKSRGVDSNQAGLVWSIPMNNPRPWTKVKKERKAFSVSKEPWLPSGNDAVQTATQKRQYDELYSAYNTARGRSCYTPTLQEAFREKNFDFISASRERQRIIKLRSDERQITRLHEEQRAQLFDIPQSNRIPASLESRLTRTSGERKVVPRDEMYDRTNRMYKVLPEVKNRQKEDRTRQDRVANRLKAKLFNKKVQRHVLDKAKHENLVGPRQPRKRG